MQHWKSLSTLSYIPYEALLAALISVFYINDGIITNSAVPFSVTELFSLF